MNFRVDFDARVSNVRFPKSIQSAVQSLLNDDARIEAYDGDLAANCENEPSYNSIFNQLTIEDANFSAADNEISRYLGLR